MDPLSLTPSRRGKPKDAKKISLAEEHGVAIATERLKYLRKSRKGDGSGKSFRRKQHRFAYRSLLEKVHSLARKRGVEVVAVDPQDTSTIGLLSELVNGGVGHPRVWERRKTMSSPIWKT